MSYLRNGYDAAAAARVPYPGKLLLTLIWPFYIIFDARWSS